MPHTNPAWSKKRPGDSQLHWLSSRRLLDKQQRVEAIAASLEQSGADPSQKAEVEEMITPSERAQLARVKHITNK